MKCHLKQKPRFWRTVLNDIGEMIFNGENFELTQLFFWTINIEIITRRILINFYRLQQRHKIII